MSAIDLVILGIVMERPQSAYDIQKDVEGHHLSRWTKISAPSIYKKVLHLREKGYLQSTMVKGERLTYKAVYSITLEGRRYFAQLMESCASQPIPLLFDFNVLIANLNKIEPTGALALIQRLRASISASAQANSAYAAQYADIPLVGKTIFQQQQLLYDTLLAWLNGFEKQFREATDSHLQLPGHSI